MHIFRALCPISIYDLRVPRKQERQVPQTPKKQSKQQHSLVKQSLTSVSTTSKLRNEEPQVRRPSTRPSLSALAAAAPATTRPPPPQRLPADRAPPPPPLTKKRSAPTHAKERGDASFRLHTSPKKRATSAPTKSTAKNAEYLLGPLNKWKENFNSSSQFVNEEHISQSGEQRNMVKQRKSSKPKVTLFPELNYKINVLYQKILDEKLIMDTSVSNDVTTVKVSNADTSSTGLFQEGGFLPSQGVRSKRSSKVIGLPKARQSSTSIAQREPIRQRGCPPSKRVRSEGSPANTAHAEATPSKGRRLTRQRSAVSARESPPQNIGLHAAKRKACSVREAPFPPPDTTQAHEGRPQASVHSLLVREKPLDLTQVIMWRENRRAKAEALGCSSLDKEHSRKNGVPPTQLTNEGNDTNYQNQLQIAVPQSLM